MDMDAEKKGEMCSSRELYDRPERVWVCNVGAVVQSCHR